MQTATTPSEGLAQPIVQPDVERRKEGEKALRKVGQGRSAEVFLDQDDQGRSMVRKIFTGELFSKLVLFLLTGSANPYTWCEAAIRTAVARRRILEQLVTFWFGGKLRLPRTGGFRRNEDFRAFELHSELIDGRHLPLRGPRVDGGAAVAGTARGAIDPLKDLIFGVMRPLQKHLEEAGFDGLVWQAGRGNPVASNNFMLEAGEGSPRWVWVDLESGVPALFAINPLATLGFYLPKSLKHRRWLFDDVDIDKLERYLGSHETALDEALGEGTYDALRRQVWELATHQEDWRTISRLLRGIRYAQSRGRLDEEQAEHYARHPLRWYLHLLAQGPRRGLAMVVAWLGLALGWLGRLDLRQMARRTLLFCLSQRFRSHVARGLVMARLYAWMARRFLERDDVHLLREELRHQDVSSYITDFGVHIMMKPLIKSFQWVVLPTLLSLGMIDVVAAAFLWVCGGMIGRTLYTLGRFVQAFAEGRRLPWVALGIGLLPVVGNAAYPAQLLYRSTDRGGELAGFILYDLMAAIGRSVPIWGGADSLTEHLFNRLGDLAVRVLRKPVA